MATSSNNNVNWDYDAAKILGKGTLGCVFLGIFNDVNVAVKRIDRTALFSASEAKDEAAQVKLDHPNIVKLFYVDSDCYFKYLIMELCQATLGDYCRGKFNGPLPSDPDALHQMTAGLTFIHSKGFIHRDIKADNVLIIPKTPSHSLLKISEFGTVKPVWSSLKPVKGTSHFFPPELLKLVDDENNASLAIHEAATVASDVFALGCLFYCFLTKGKHPFSDGKSHTLSIHLPINIMEGRYNLNGLHKHQAWAHHMIAAMIQADPKSRWGLDKVAKVLAPLLNNSPSN